MSWESRRRGGRYYTRTVRRAGKIVRQYLGKGPEAEVAAAENAARRQERQAQAQARREDEARWVVLEARLEELCFLSNQILTAALLVAGYRRHDRGPWRKRRHVCED